MWPLTRHTVALVALAGAALAACDSGDGRTLADPTTSTTAPGPAADGDVTTYAGGTATFEIAGGETLAATVTFCRYRRTVPSGGAEQTVVLQVEGTGTTGAGEPFTVSAVRTVPAAADENVIETVSVRYGDTTESLPDRIWEAQRLVDPDTGEVTDLHGEGTMPLLEVAEEGATLVVAAVDAAFHQFGMSGGPDGPAGTATLRLTCS